MENENIQEFDTVGPIPRYYHESEVARLERTIKRFWVLILVLIALLVASNGAWLYYESQMEVTETTVTQENTDGTNNYNFIGNDGDIINGETNRESQKTIP